MTTNAKNHVAIYKILKQTADDISVVNTKDVNSRIRINLHIMWRLTRKLREMVTIDDLDPTEYEKELEECYNETTEAIIMKSRKALLTCIVMIITSVINYLKTNDSGPEIYMLLSCVVKLKLAIVRSTDMCTLLFWATSRSEPHNDQTHNIMNNISYSVSWFGFNDKESIYNKIYDERLNLEFIKSGKIQQGMLAIAESADIMKYVTGDRDTIIDGVDDTVTLMIIAIICKQENCKVKSVLINVGYDLIKCEYFLKILKRMRKYNIENFDNMMFHMTDGNLESNNETKDQYVQYLIYTVLKDDKTIINRAVWAMEKILKDIKIKRRYQNSVPLCVRRSKKTCSVVIGIISSSYKYERLSWNQRKNVLERLQLYRYIEIMKETDILPTLLQSGQQCNHIINAYNTCYVGGIKTGDVTIMDMPRLEDLKKQGSMLIYNTKDKEINIINPTDFNVGSTVKRGIKAKQVNDNIIYHADEEFTGTIVSGILVTNVGCDILIGMRDDDEKTITKYGSDMTIDTPGSIMNMEFGGL
jgi:hypothetical protein